MFKRFAYIISIFIGIIFLVLVLFRGLGDPTVILAGQSGNKETLLNIQKELHLDQPTWKQFLFYLNDVSPICFHHKETIARKSLKGIFIGGNLKFGLKVPYLGKSYQSGQPVVDMLMQALPGTLILSMAAMLIAIPIGIFLGITSAVKRNSFTDHLSTVVSVAGISLPSFFVAIVMIWIFAITLQSITHLPIQGSWITVNEITGESSIAWKNLILPAITLGIRPLALITQLTRSAVLDVLQKDYVRTAYAKGLSKSRVLWKHVLPNAMNPVITSVTGWFGELMAGAIFIEYIFGWHGIGNMTVQALDRLDYPVVMGAVLFSACVFLLVNFSTDKLYRIFDPRMRG